MTLFFSANAGVSCKTKSNKGPISTLIVLNPITDYKTKTKIQTSPESSEPQQQKHEISYNSNS